MITKVRIIKENGIYKIQEYEHCWLSRGWDYVKVYGLCAPGDVSTPLQFKTKKEAEDYIEKKYVTRIIKEYDVTNYIKGE